MHQKMNKPAGHPQKRNIFTFQFSNYRLYTENYKG